MTRRLRPILAIAGVLLLLAYVAVRELEDRGYLDLPRYEPAPETVTEAFAAVIGDQDPSCLETDVEVLAGYWRWVAQFTILEGVSVQRAGANEFVNLLAEHRIALIDLAPTHGCTGVFTSLDAVSATYIDFITAFRQDEGRNVMAQHEASYAAAVKTSTQNLTAAIKAASAAQAP